MASPPPATDFRRGALPVDPPLQPTYVPRGTLIGEQFDRPLLKTGNEAPSPSHDAPMPPTCVPRPTVVTANISQAQANQAAILTGGPWSDAGASEAR